MARFAGGLLLHQPGGKVGDIVRILTLALGKKNTDESRNSAESRRQGFERPHAS